MPKSRAETSKSSGQRGGFASTTAEVVEALRSNIAAHVIPPGAKLLEQELAQEFRISRARVRDVFNALESRGLIRRLPNRGAIVSRLNIEQVFAIYSVREVLEGLCVRLATQNVPKETWQDMVERFGPPMDNILKAGDIEDYERAYSELRGRFIEAADNAVLTGMLDSIFEKTQVIMRRVLILPGRAERGLEQHRAVLAAMRRGDAAAAEALKRANIRSAIEDLRRYQHFVF